MKDYIERVLHQAITLTEYSELNSLPLTFRKSCRVYTMNINDQDCLVAEPIETMNLADIRKQYRMLEHGTGKHCVMYLYNLNYYAKDKLVEEGIPFVWENHQVYLPFMGMLLNEKAKGHITTCNQISFMTQKLLITAMYQDWQGVNVSTTSSYMNVSKMSVTRAFDEIEALELPYLDIKNRGRKFTCIQDKRSMWEKLKPYMRNPVIAQFPLREMPMGVSRSGGISALAKYSLIEDNHWRTFDVPKSQMGELRGNKFNIVTKDEVPACVVQETGYTLQFNEANATDPLSLALIL